MWVPPAVSKTFFGCLIFICYCVAAVGQHGMPNAACIAAIDSALIDVHLPISVTVLDLKTRQCCKQSKNLAASDVQVMPGSSVKPILAFLAGQHGVCKPDETITCKGVFGNGFRCFASHGPLTLAKSLATSCNAYAFALAVRLGSDKIVRGFESFGFEPPDTAIANTDLGAFAYGTGHNPNFQTTTTMCHVYANLLDSLQSTTSSVPTDIRNEILTGMYQTVNSEFGSAQQAASLVTGIAGKTGTAEGSRTSKQTNSTWFIGFAPFEKPQYVVAVMVMGGRSGGSDAAPVAKQILEMLLR